MTVISIRENGHRAEVRFGYNKDAVEVIRGVPGRRWHADERYWSVPSEFVQSAAIAFDRAGHVVNLNGAPWVSPVPKSKPIASGIDAALVALFKAIPPTLHPATFRALTRAFHPDVGGTTELMQALNRHRDNGAS